MSAPAYVADAARARIQKNIEQVRRSIADIEAGRPGDAEPDESRRAAVLERRTGMSHGDALRVAPSSGREKVWGRTIDFVDVAFLERGTRASRSVARVATRDGQGLGTGFMISPRLFLTNNHVLPDKAATRDLVIEFDFERDLTGALKLTSRFEFAPTVAFVTNHEDDLDYTVVAVGERLAGLVQLAAYGHLPISGARDKHQLGDYVSLIQHPDARPKEAVLRENQLVSRAQTALHYVADTEPGSSGSPVFNVLWEVVALHHWGGPHRDLIDHDGRPLAKTVNEGIRISAIVGDLNTRKNGLPAPERALIEQALTIGLHSEASPIAPPAMSPASASTTVQVAADGTATWTIPLRVSVQLGGLAAGVAPVAPGTFAPAPNAAAAVPEAPSQGERALAIDEDYDNRSGYDPGFLPGAEIPLPGFKTETALAEAAVNREARAGRSRVELPYEHFSVVMNGRRRLAFFTATNIDGRLAKSYDRNTGVISDPHARDDDEERGSEATERWFTDRRIDDSEQTPSNLFDGQTAFDADGQPIDDRRTAAHRNRMFQQGHLTRRADPVWGTEDRVVIRANADTFHVTNRAPQVGFFNMGIRKAGAEAGHPGGQLHWRALEDYVLNNAIADKARVTVFTGPAFDDERDMPWDRGMAGMRGFKAPVEFWKVIVRVEQGVLRATALLADQSPLVDYIPERALSDAEAARVSFAKVKRYHVSVGDIEARTAIDFGAAILAADTHPGGERRLVTSLHELVSVGPSRASRKQQKSQASASASGRSRTR